jgi:tRNA pseudouridine32 synthase/23S rRNA pseudouridine746 synthase
MPDAITNKLELHVQISDSGKTALDWLSETSAISRQKIKQAMQKGCVWLERDLKQTYIQRLRRVKKVLNHGDTLHFYYDESVLAVEPKPAVLVADLGAYSVWNKPSGMLSQGSKWGDHCTIYRWSEIHLRPERAAFVVHRLDRAASGLIILAHNKTVAAQFSEMFEKREIEKRYRAVVQGDFSSALPRFGKRLTITAEIDNKSAISHAELIEYNADENTSTLEVRIETGRKHQIRKHLSGIGHPVVGDRLYGSGDSIDNLKLTAASLKFICPVKSGNQLFTLF